MTAPNYRTANICANCDFIANGKCEKHKFIVQRDGICDDYQDNFTKEFMYIIHGDDADHRGTGKYRSGLNREMKQEKQVSELIRKCAR